MCHECLASRAKPRNPCHAPSIQSELNPSVFALIQTVFDQVVYSAAPRPAAQAGPQFGFPGDYSGKGSAAGWDRLAQTDRTNASTPIL
jgi:hypothetical protein